MNYALVVAGGNGVRTGQKVPKQFLTINDVPIIMYTLINLQNNQSIDKIVCVVPDGWQEFIKLYSSQYSISKFYDVVIGGENRHFSIFNGLTFLNTISTEKDIVCIIDANRPMIPKDIIIKCIDIIKDNNGFSIAIEPCFDSMFISKGKKIIENLIDRNILIKGQTPECAFIKKLLDFYKKANIEGKTSFSTTELLFYYNQKIQLVEGSSRSFKVTTKDDIDILRALINSEKQ